MGGHNLEVGRRGESLAAEEYERRGYRVLSRNWRDGRSGELDLVLARERDRLLVVCEVKSRSSVRYGLPVEAVDHRKQRRLRQLTHAFLAAHDVRPSSIRFDVASVLAGEVEILEAAF
jgi:putative endonuclease